MAYLRKRILSKKMFVRIIIFNYIDKLKMIPKKLDLFFIIIINKNLKN